MFNFILMIKRNMFKNEVITVFKLILLFFACLCRKPPRLKTTFTDDLADYAYNVCAVWLSLKCLRLVSQSGKTWTPDIWTFTGVPWTLRYKIPKLLLVHLFSYSTTFFKFWATKFRIQTSESFGSPVQRASSWYSCKTSHKPPLSEVLRFV